MTYLITQIFILLLAAGLVGLILGWYLTRLSADSARNKLFARLVSAESDARELRVELDTAVTARGHAESERKQLTEELQALRAQPPANGEDSLAALQGELDACREQLMAAGSETAARPAPAAASGPIAKVSAAAAEAAAAMSTDALAADDGAPPVHAEVDGEPDDLQQIKGIGPKIAGILKELGIQRFEQIATWSPENIAWVNERLKFKGRIEREQWIPQAKALLGERDGP